MGPLGRAGRRGTLRGRRGIVCHLRSFCVAGVAKSHIHLRFAWQASHSWHWVARLGPLGRAGRRGTLRGRRGTISHPPSFCVASVAQSHIRLGCASAQQASHLSYTTLSPTIFDTPSFTRNFVTNHLRHTTLSHTPSFTPNFVTHHLSRTICHTPLCHPPSFTHHLSHTTLSHTIIDTPLCHTPSFTHHLRHTLFHTSSF